MLNLPNVSTHVDCHFVAELATSKNRTITVDDDTVSEAKDICHTSPFDSCVLFLCERNLPFIDQRYKNANEHNLEISEDANAAFISSSNAPLLEQIKNLLLSDQNSAVIVVESENEIIENHVEKWNLQSKIHIKLNDLTLFDEPIPDIMLQLMKCETESTSFQILYSLMMSHQDKYLVALPLRYPQFVTQIVPQYDAQYLDLIGAKLVNNENNEPIDIPSKLVFIHQNVLNESYAEIQREKKWNDPNRIDAYIITATTQAFKILSDWNYIHRPPNDRYSKSQYDAV